jgi:hypothetical protein
VGEGLQNPQPDPPKPTQTQTTDTEQTEEAVKEDPWIWNLVDRMPQTKMDRLDKDEELGTRDPVYKTDTQFRWARSMTDEEDPTKNHQKQIRDNMVDRDGHIPANIITKSGGFDINSGRLDFRSMTDKEDDEDVKLEKKEKKHMLMSYSEDEEAYITTNMSGGDWETRTKKRGRPTGMTSAETKKPKKKKRDAEELVEWWRKKKKEGHYHVGFMR